MPLSHAKAESGGAISGEMSIKIVHATVGRNAVNAMVTLCL